MALCFLYSIILLLLYPILSEASFSLSSELTKFIPGCAQQCFKSFLDANYNESEGGSQPSLLFLCSTKTRNGYTVGEGAVACIVSEDDNDFCTGSAAQETVVAVAFEMCNGEPESIPNTHTAITATLVLGTSGVVVVPSATTSSSFITSRTSIRPTITSTQVTTRQFPSQTTTTATNTATPPPGTQKAVTGQKLSKNQIIGITGAAVGGTALVIGCLVLLLCLRRRRLSKRGSDTLPFQKDPSTTPPMYDIAQYSAENRTPGWLGGLTTPPKVPHRLEISPPNMFSRRSILPDNIGLAISPDGPDPVTQRISKLLPEKPTLRLVMPDEPTATNHIKLNHQVIPWTQGTVPHTRHETAFLNGQSGTGFRRPGANVQPNVAGLHPGQTNQLSWQFGPNLTVPNNGSSSIQFNNQGSNHGQLAPGPRPNLYVQPLNVRRQELGSFSRPRPSMLESPSIRGLEAPMNLRPVTQSSSIYSQQTPHTVYSSFYNPPSTRRPSLNVSEANARPYTSRPQSYKQVGPYDRASNGSFTSFESEESSQGNKSLSASRTSGMRKSVSELSPVAGSPASGKSPVSYPKIPAPVRLTVKTMQTVPPPPRPDFGAAYPRRVDPNANIAHKPWRAAEIAAQRQRNLMRNDSRLRDTRQNSQSPRPDLLPAAQIKERMNIQPGTELGYSTIYNADLAQDNNATGNELSTLSSQRQFPQLPTQPQMQPQPQSQSQTQQSQQAPDVRPGMFVNTHSRSNSTISAKSTSSSLLAKRLGADKAAALHLTTKSSVRGKPRPSWRVLKRDEIEAAKDPGWRPQLVQQIQRHESQSAWYNNGPNSQNCDERLESGEALTTGKSVRFDVQLEQDERDEAWPPVTPGWVPKLTPTRRGDELFLSVQ